MELIRGELKKPIKCLLYGPEGIGKSTFASMFPTPVFIDTEGSTVRMNVVRTRKPESWAALLDQVMFFSRNPGEFRTLVVDTADWAEKLCIAHICAKGQVTSIEGFGYGKGYTYLEEEFVKLLHALNAVIDAGMHVCLTAHAALQKVEEPNEVGSYDRWAPKLLKRNTPLVKEWADMILFANYKVFVSNVDGKGATKGKNKASGGTRMMYTSHHPCWDAKNRFGLPEELPFEFGQIGHLFDTQHTDQAAVRQEPAPTPASAQSKIEEPPAAVQAPVPELRVPKALAQMMEQYGVTEDQIRRVVARRGYYPEATPIENYDPNFITGVLVGAWDQVYKMIKEDNR